eukprot:6488348-Amphidinium_carterae.1
MSTSCCGDTSAGGATICCLRLMICWIPCTGVGAIGIGGLDARGAAAALGEGLRCTGEAIRSTATAAGKFAGDLRRPLVCRVGI